MQVPPARYTEDRSTSGVFSYLDETAEPSLFRNGKVLTRRDLDGNDDRSEGLSRREVELTVCDARTLSDAARPTCDANGFELVNAPLVEQGIEFLDQESVVHAYYEQCAQLVTEHTGARVYPFDHNIRSASGKRAGKRLVGGQQVQDPLHFVHGDYTLTSAPQRLRDLSRPPTGNDTLCSMLQVGETLIDQEDVERVLNGGRFSIINVWRNIADTPVLVHPLALCDSRSVASQDLVVFEIHYQHRVGENYFARYAPAHRWYYYPHMTRAEVLLIKQWDSAGAFASSNGKVADAAETDTPSTFSFHSAFEQRPEPPDGPDRWSIEVRCMVIYDQSGSG